MLAAIAACALFPTVAHAACPGAGTQVRSVADVPQARRAVRCLLNRERRAHGLPRLHGNDGLRAAATRHSFDMRAHGFFEHTNLRGLTVLDRILRTPYLHAGQHYQVGENIGWGEAHLGTPRAMVTAWMHSPGHRANILHGAFHDIGIGIARGTPEGPGGVTYTTDFGARS